MREPAIVAVAGSCITRDNFNSRFNPEYKRHFTVELSTNQTSMIALMSDPVDVEFTPLDAMSDYDRWNVHSDLSREFLPLLAELRPDYLILDFFGDVHFGVLRQADGRYLTDNRWKLWRTDYYQEQMQAGNLTRIRFEDDEDAYFALWTEAMDRFAAFVAAHCPDTVVVVHYGRNVDSVLVPDRPWPLPIHRYKELYRLDVERTNAFWSRLDDHAAQHYGWERIDLRAERAPTFVDHPWGAFHVHYTMDYYHRFLAELHKIHLRRTVDADVVARLEQIESAAREPAEREIAVRDAALARQSDRLAQQRDRLTRKDRRIARQQARIDRLESRGVLAAARWAVARRLGRGRGPTTAR